MAAIDGWDSLAYTLLAQRLSSGGSAQLTITAASMAPLLLPGDRVLLAKAPVPALCVGDLVALAASPRPIVHRLVAAPRRKGRRLLVTKGDAAISYDRQFPPEAFLGHVVSVQRGDKTLMLAARIARWGACILAYLSCLCVRAAHLPCHSSRRITLFLLSRTMVIVAGVVWRTCQRAQVY